MDKFGNPSDAFGLSFILTFFFFLENIKLKYTIDNF